MTDKEQQNQPEKQPIGRPVERKMPEPIPDTPENIAHILMTTTPPKWTYQDEGEEPDDKE